MRLGYVDAATAHPHSLQWWERNRQDPDTAIHLVRTWAWSPWLQEAQQRLGHALHERTAVPTRLKELAIVRVCSMVRSPYELFHHVPIARLAGVRADQVEALAIPNVVDDASFADAFDPVERAVVRYVDEFDAGRGVQDDTFDELRAHLTPEQIVPLSQQIGYWGCNARLTVALQVDTEPWISYPEPDPPAGGDATSSPDAPVDLPVEPAGRLGVPSLGSLGDKARSWIDRWDGEPPLLVRAWTWSEHVQATSQNLWATLVGDDVELDRRRRSLVAHRVAWLRHSPYVLDLLDRSWPALDDETRAATHGDARALDRLPADERHLLDFVDAWENGLGVGDTTFARAFADHGRRAIVEAQLVAGFVGTQARLATALQLPHAAPNP